jgi:hypothetical protein
VEGRPRVIAEMSAFMAGWLTKHGFAIEQTFGGHDGRPYTPDAPRATFWARKAGGEWI